MEDWLNFTINSITQTRSGPCLLTANGVYRDSKSWYDDEYFRYEVMYIKASGERSEEGRNTNASANNTTTPGQEWPDKRRSREERELWRINNKVL